MLFSEMNLDDYESIKDLYHDEYDDFYTLNVLKSEIESPNTKYVALKEDNTIIGFGGLLMSVDDAELNYIVVKKDLRGNHYGEMLMENLISLANKNEKNKIFLEVNANNNVAINLYKKEGFETINVRRKYYNGEDDAIIMCREERSI